jgi:hypothetical protein
VLFLAFAAWPAGATERDALSSVAEPLKLAQPTFYVPEDSDSDAQTSNNLPATALDLNQPSFIAPIADSSASQPMEQPPLQRTQSNPPAPVAKSPSRWSAMWQQLLGRTSADTNNGQTPIQRPVPGPSPESDDSVARYQFASALPAGTSAAGTSSDSTARASASLIQQVAGISELPAVRDGDAATPVNSQSARGALATPSSTTGAPQKTAQSAAGSRRSPGMGYPTLTIDSSVPSAVSQQANSLWQQATGAQAYPSQPATTVAPRPQPQPTVPISPQSQVDPVLGAVANAWTTSKAHVETTVADLRPPLTNQIPTASEAPSGVSVVSHQSPVTAGNAKRIENSESTKAPWWAQPFYVTNPREAGSPAANGQLSTASGSKSVDSGEAVAGSTLVRQLALSRDDDLRKPAAASTDSAIMSEASSWDQGWTVYSPSVPNPLGSTFDSRQLDQGADSRANLAAYQQDGGLEPIPQPEPADLDVRTGETVREGQQGSAGQDDSLAEAEQLGEEPEDTSLQFLRTATVLLEPGDSQCDVGIQYLLSENDFPILLTTGSGDIVGVAKARFRVRELSMPIQYRRGLTRRVQGFIGAPIGWSNTQLAFADVDAFENDGGLGDVTFGATIQLKEAAVDTPYWVATIAATAPTGGDPFRGVAGLAPSAPSLGQGFWSISGNLLFIQPYDPLVVFYGLGMERFFSREFVGIEFEPGAQYTYTLGVGFAVNERITLSSRFQGAYREELEANDVRVVGTNAEPMTIRLAATISKPCDRLVEPFVEFGLTDDSVSSFIGVTWTF